MWVHLKVQILKCPGTFNKLVVLYVMVKKVYDQAKDKAD